MRRGSVKVLGISAILPPFLMFVFQTFRDLLYRRTYFSIRRLFVRMEKYVIFVLPYSNLINGRNMAFEELLFLLSFFWGTNSILM